MEGAYVENWYHVALDLFGCSLLISGFSALLASDTKPGLLLIMSGYGITVVVDFFRVLAFHDGTSYSSAATQHLEFTATMMLGFGLFLSVIAQFWFLFFHGNKSLVWLGITGSCIMFIGSLLHAVRIYMMRCVYVFEDTEGSLYQSTNEPLDASIVINGSEDTKGSQNPSSNQPLDVAIVVNRGSQNPSSNQPLDVAIVVNGSEDTNGSQNHSSNQLSDGLTS